MYKAIDAILIADATVTGLVPAARIKPLAASMLNSASALPNIVYSIDDAVHNIENSINLTTGKAVCVQSSFAVDCNADSYNSAQTVGEAVRKALHGKQGTYGGYYVASIQCTNTPDDFVPAAQTGTGKPSGIYRMIVNFDGIYSELT